MRKITIAIQIVSIVSMGAFAGAMIMLYTAILSFWKKASPEEFLGWYSNYASGIMDATGPLVMSSILLPLICMVLVWKIPKSRIYWLISLLLSVIIMVITLSYFVDVNTSFADQSIELNRVKETLETWGQFHIIRISIAFISSVFGGMGIVQYLSKNQNTN